MGRKKKKSSNVRNKGTFNDVLSLVKNKQYAAANTLLKKIRIRQEEAGQAKQLKACLNLRDALDHMKSGGFEDALKMLDSVLAMQPKPGFPFPKDTAYLLTGISRLYLGQYNDAVQALENVNPDFSPEIPFLHLLALLYTKQDVSETEAAFQKTHNALFSRLTAKQKKYIPVAWNLTKGNFKAALSLLEKIKGSGDQERTNIKALVSILAEKPFDSKNNDFVHTLYKALLNLPTSAKDNSYLDRFEEFEPLIFAIENSQETIQLNEHLTQMCIEGVPLTKDSFDFCYPKISPNQKARFVYNQVANIYNLAPENKEVLFYLRKHMTTFMEVPEALMLYIEITLQHMHKIRPESFWSIIHGHLDKFGHNMPASMLDNIGWRIYNISINNIFTNYEKPTELIALAKQFPEMIGLKMQLLLLQTLIPKLQLPNEIKDIFSQPNIKQNESAILSALSHFLESFMLSSFYEEDVLKTSIFNAECFQKNLMEYLALHPPHEEATVVLSLLRNCYEFYLEIEEEFEVDLNAKHFKKLEDSYNTAKGYFKHQLEDPTFAKEYGKLVVSTPYGVVKKLVYSRSNEKEIKKQIKALLESFQPVEVLDSLIQVLQEQFFYFKNSTYVAIYFKVLLETRPDEAEDMVKHYCKSMQLSQSSDSPFDFTDRFNMNVLKELLAIKGKKQHKAIVTFIHHFPIALAQYNVPAYYNTAGKALLYLKAFKEKNPSFAVDSTIVKALVVFIEKMVKKKNLKTLGKTLATCKEFFKL